MRRITTKHVVVVAFGVRVFVRVCVCVCVYV